MLGASRRFYTCAKEPFAARRCNSCQARVACNSVLRGTRLGGRPLLACDYSWYVQPGNVPVDSSSYLKGHYPLTIMHSDLFRFYFDKFVKFTCCLNLCSSPPLRKHEQQLLRWLILDQFYKSSKTCKNQSPFCAKHLVRVYSCHPDSISFTFAYLHICHFLFAGRLSRHWPMQPTPRQRGSRQQSLWLTELVPFAVATVFIILRITSRRLKKVKLWFDDYFAICTYVCCHLSNLQATLLMDSRSCP